MTRRIVQTTCTRDCPSTCGLLAEVEDGRLVRLTGDPDHPLTRGAICAKTAAYGRRVYSPERITRPMVRSAGAWEQVDWDTALDLVAEAMQKIVEQSGPEAILHHQGYGERTALKLLNRYFFNLLGGVTTLRGSLCGGAGQSAQDMDFGKRVSHDPLDHENSRSMVLWARNPASTQACLVPLVRAVRERGGTVVLVDPATTRSAALADLHVRPRPGGDGCLALAVAKLILRAGAEDREFIERHGAGFAAYRAVLDRFGVGELCELAGVGRADVEGLARVYMHEHPTATLLGWGLHRHEQAHHMIRPIDALGALSGNIGVPGGGVSQGFEEYGPYDPQWWGDHLNPERRTLSVARLGRELLEATDPPVRMIFVNAGNPACMAPDSARVAEGFGRAELVVYCGHFLDDTADLAHVFLPATTFPEEVDVVASYGHNFVGAVSPAIEPVGQCRSEFRIFSGLAERFPFAERFCRSEQEWLADICAPLAAQGADLAALRRGAVRQDRPLVPYADRRFPTTNGRFRFLTEFIPPSPVTDERFPYTLLTTAPHGHICSERTLAGHEPLPVVRLARAEAERIGATDGDMVLVRSGVGQVRARLATDPKLRPDVLLAERGGWAKAGHGLNRLTRDLPSRVGEGTAFYDTRVSVEPLREPDVAACS